MKLVSLIVSTLVLVVALEVPATAQWHETTDSVEEDTTTQEPAPEPVKEEVYDAGVSEEGIGTVQEECAGHGGSPDVDVQGYDIC